MPEAFTVEGKEFPKPCVPWRKDAFGDAEPIAGEMTFAEAWAFITERAKTDDPDDAAEYAIMSAGECWRVTLDPEQWAAEGRKDA